MIFAKVKAAVSSSEEAAAPLTINRSTPFRPRSSPLLTGFSAPGRFFAIWRRLKMKGHPLVRLPGDYRIADIFPVVGISGCSPVKTRFIFHGNLSPFTHCPPTRGVRL